MYCETRYGLLQFNDTEELLGLIKVPAPYITFDKGGSDKKFDNNLLDFPVKVFSQV